MTPNPLKFLLKPLNPPLSLESGSGSVPYRVSIHPGVWQFDSSSHCCARLNPPLLVYLLPPHTCSKSGCSSQDEPSAPKSRRLHRHLRSGHWLRLLLEHLSAIHGRCWSPSISWPWS